MELLQHKNSEDQIQDFIWFLSKSKVSVDVDDLAERASKAKAKADTAAAYQSIRTVGSLLLTNSDFRLFLSDLNVIGREVFKDTAFKLSSVAEEAGNKIEPSQKEQKALKEPGADSSPPPSADDLNGDLVDVANVVGNGAVQVAKEAESSLEDKITGDEKDTLIYRLKQVVLNLRKRRDYSDSVSTISTLIKRYAMVYSRAVQEAVDTTQDDVSTNRAMDKALQNFWTLITSFGEKKEWE